jgi:pimeloyl-ACP methyl ester carboxylesterase
LAANEQAVVLLAKHLGVSVEHIHANAAGFGHSLGAAALTQYAAIYPLQRLILLSPFTTMKAMAQRSVGWPLCELLVHRFDNQKNLSHIATRGLPPTTIIHGERDGFIPSAMGRALAQAHPTITYIAVEDAGHNDVIDLGDAAIRKAMSEEANQR